MGTLSAHRIRRKGREDETSQPLARTTFDKGRVRQEPGRVISNDGSPIVQRIEAAGPTASDASPAILKAEFFGDLVGDDAALV